MTNVQEQIHECLRYLAGVCDYAEKQDGQGFNSVDTWVGHQLASQESLSLSETKFAYDIVRKYRKQLEHANHTLPTTDDVASYIGDNKVEEYTRHQLRAMKREEQHAVEQEAMREEVKQTCPDKVFVAHGRLIVQFTYNPAKVNAMQPLKKSVKDWAFNRYGNKEWSFPKSAVEQVLEVIKGFDDFTYAPEIDMFRQEALADAELAQQQAELEARMREAEKQYTLEAVRPYMEGNPLPCGQALFAHQREAVRLMLERGRIILAHDMGLGKSRSSLVAAKAYDLPVLVIAPATLRINWLREAEAVGVCIEVYSWAKIPPAPETNYVLIADESHFAQNLKSQRTQNFLELVENARAVFCLTGTPLKNGRPSNLFPLLKACRHPLAESKKAYEIRYCNAQLRVVNRRGTEVWDTTGAAHLDELHQKTKDVILYQKKESCIDLPPKVRVLRPVEASAEAAKAYNTILEDLRTAHKNAVDARLEAFKQARKEYQDALDAGEDVEEPEEVDPESAEAIVELGILSHAGSHAKVEHAVELAQEVLEQGQSIVLFTRFVDTAEKIASALECHVLRGGLSDDQKQNMIDQFQAGRTKALVCTLGAGGVGITLTAAQTVILVDRPWTPGDCFQAEDRLHRIGQQGNVTAIWLQYGEADAKIDTLLQEKQERIDLVLEGKRKSMRGVSRSVQAMAKEIMYDIFKK